MSSTEGGSPAATAAAGAIGIGEMVPECESGKRLGSRRKPNIARLDRAVKLAVAALAFSTGAGDGLRTS
jgi:hypothetical protein